MRSPQPEQPQQPQQPQLLNQLNYQICKCELLELDTETQQSVLNALENSGKSLASFIQLACKIYANTVNGKHKHADGDLSSAFTSELLDPEVTQYKTHPGKIKELTKRAIKAIQMHNDSCTEDRPKMVFVCHCNQWLDGFPRSVRQ